MSRDVSGNYTLPAGNPVVDGTLIDVTWANPTMADIAVQLNNVPTRDGVLGMLAPFKVTAGTASLPAVVPSGDPNTGMYFPSADTVGFSTSGVARLLLTSAGFLGIGNTPSQLLELGGLKLSGSQALVGDSTFATTIPVGTSVALGGGIALVRGADVAGIAFCAVYILAVKVLAGALPNVTASLVARVGSTAPTFTFSDSGGFVTITSSGNGTASYVSFIGF